MASTLLSHLAHSLAPRPEEIATRSLAYLLNADRALPQSLWELLHPGRAFGWCDVHEYVAGKAAAEVSGIPDITGKAKHGTPVLIEGKFWAGLTDNQPEGYLKGLSQDQDLIFVVPRSRVLTLATKLGAEWPIQREGLQSRIDEGGRHHHIISWQLALKTFKNALQPSQHQIGAEIEQLLGLCNRIDEDGFLLFSSADFNPAIGRKIHQMGRLIHIVTDTIRNRNNSPLKKSPKDEKWSGEGVVGRSMLIRNPDIWLNFYFSTTKWHSVKNTESPYWIDVFLPKTPEENAALEVLLKFRGAASIDGDINRLSISLPIKPMLGREQHDIIQYSVEFLETLALEIQQELAKCRLWQNEQ